MAKESQRMDEGTAPIVDTGSPKADENAPKDKGNFVYLVQFLYGMAILLPFNIVIACVDFYEDKVSV